MAEKKYYVKLEGGKERVLRKDSDGLWYFIYDGRRHEVKSHHDVVDSRGRSLKCKECSEIKKKKRKKCQNRKCYLWREYRMTEEDYKEMWDKQDGCCDICGEEFENHTEGKVDHNHETGAVRALLCNKCNTGLGDFDDSPSRLRKAARYIEGHN